MLKDEIEAICPMLRDQYFELHYHIFGTSPKEYKIMTNDTDVMEMVQYSNEKNRVEVIVITQESTIYVMCVVGTKNIDDCRVLDLYNSDSASGEENNILINAINDGFLNCGSSDAQSILVGARFEDSKSFKHVLRTEAILHNFAIKIKSSDRSRVIATCAYQGCPWRVRASVCTDGHSFEVRKLEDTHICPGVNRAGNKQATASWVANQIQDIVKKNPDIPPKHINSNLEATYGLSLPYMKLWRSREEARDNIFGVVEDNYCWVPTLRSELTNRNPGSHVTYTYDVVDSSFQRFYASFKVCSDGFLAGCRHLIGVDACHLKSKYLGVLLYANSLDGNNGLYTIAFAVVENESKNTWTWFLRNLDVTLDCELNQLAIISDMEKGLADAIKTVFPSAEHRICMRHLWKNMKKNFRCSDAHRVRNLVWGAANVYSKHEYDAKMQELFRTSPHVHAYLIALQCKWAKHSFSSAIKNHHNTNNMSESFNAWIREARGKPVVDLIDMIRGMVMELRAQRKLNTTCWRGELVPHVEDYIREITSKKEQFIVRQSSASKCEVEGNHERNEVCIDSQECSCGNRYKMAYEGSIATMPGKEQWSIVDDGVIIKVPNTLRPRGRPKKRRIRNFLEIHNNKKPKSTHKCSRCGLWGHHKSTCKNPLGDGTSETNFAMGDNEEFIERTITAQRQKLPFRRDTNCS